MKTIIFLLLLAGLVTGKSPHLNDNIEKLFRNEEYTNVGPEYLQDAMDDLWKKYTRDDLEPPQFYSPAYDRNITGKNMESYYGRPIYAFQGIQYGEPPTKANNRRFRPARPSTLYEGPTDPIVANHLGFKCPQSPMIGHQPTGDEDCLYLNVYTPVLPGSNESELLPVMHFIHGGGFILGDSSLYLPTKLLEHDVILVTIHYRLGAFGFFNLDDDFAPGNSALYDMILSLEWVNKYIADFGGDPDRVTVFGQSAGSVSSNYMLLIPQAKDLVNGVISESGSTLDVWAVDPDPRYAAEYIANYVGCPIDTNDLDIYTCVENASQDDLVLAENSLVSTDRENGLMGFRGAAPSIQTPGNSWDPLIIKHPREYFENGEVNPIPLLLGTNKQEGSFVAGTSYKAYLSPNELSENELYMRNQFTADLLYSFGVEDTSHAISTSFNDFYCPDIDMGTFESAAPCYTDMMGVLFLKGSGWECVNLHSYYTDNATFHYSFDFESDDNMYIWFLGAPPPGLDPGVSHGDEMMYLFTMPAIMELKQIDTMKRMTLLWTNFATYGDPTPDENSEPWMDLNLPKWQQYKTDDHHYMLMRDEFTMEEEFSDRWTVTIDEQPSSSTTTVGTPGTGSTTLDPTDPCNGPTQADYDALQKDYDELESKSNAYLACMIVFIILFVIADGVGLYIFMKNR